MELREKLRNLDGRINNLLQEKQELLSLLYSSSATKKNDRIQVIKKQLDSIFKEVTKNSCKFFKNIEDYNNASKKVQELQKKREELINELRLLELS